MSFIAKEWDIFVTKNGGVNSTSYKLLAFNSISEEAYEDVVDKSMLTGVDSKGNEYKMLEVSRDAFNMIESKLYQKYSLESEFIDWVVNYQEEPKIKKTENLVPASLVKKGINGDLSYEELREIVSVDLEEDDYYNYEAFIKGILRFLRGEISENYYTSWVILCSWALSANKFKPNSKKQKIYDSLAWSFDGHSFDDFNDLKEKECNDMIAIIKYKNHLLQNVNKTIVPPFYNENKTIVYVNFAFGNHHNEFYNVCIANEKENVFKMALVANPVFLPNVNYTFVGEDEMLNLTNDYFEYYFDPTINEYDYIGVLPFRK